MVEQKTLQVGIVKRFMTDAEWAEFQKEYWNNKQGSGTHDRAHTLSAEVTDEDMAQLKAYAVDTDTPLEDIKDASEVKNVGYRVGRTALRIIHQHPELLQRI